LKYQVVLNVVDRVTGRPTPLRLSCEVKGLPRDAAVRAALQYASQQDIHVNSIPSAVKSVGAPARRSPKVRLPPL